MAAINVVRMAGDLYRRSANMKLPTTRLKYVFDEFDNNRPIDLMAGST